jgi:cell division protein FtsW (lipid II flippase)
MKERLFKNFITTILGVILILASLVAVFINKATAEEVAGWITLGVTFLRSKDSLIALPAPEEVTTE